ncbi:MAG: hypothetical protein GX050_05160 [Firmicutes bacterium]|nr:hypothetical protein [Bacillota bacterium]
MEKIPNQEMPLTAEQGKVLNLIHSWLEQNNFPEADRTQAEQIWLDYVRKTRTPKITNINMRIWAATVIYLLSRQRGYSWVNQNRLAKDFGISSGSISKRWQEMNQVLERNNPYQNYLSATDYFLNPQTMEVFRRLLVFTRTSNRWKNYVEETFYQFMGADIPSLPAGLILELYIYITCDREIGEGKRIVDCFVESCSDLNKEELTFLQRIKASRFGLFEVKAVLSDQVLLFFDLFRSQQVQVEYSSQELKIGDFTMGRIIPRKEDDGALWSPGIYLMKIDRSEIKELEPAAKKWFWDYSVRHKGWATNEEFIQENSFLFWRWFFTRRAG